MWPLGGSICTYSSQIRASVSGSSSVGSNTNPFEESFIVGKMLSQTISNDAPVK